MTGNPSLEARKAAVRQRLSLSDVVEPHVKLSGHAKAAKRRGKCPFHGSNSPSLALFDAHTGEGGGFCFGCQWKGDMFRFVMDIKGVDFTTALAELEGLAGLSPSGREPSGSLASSAQSAPGGRSALRSGEAGPGPGTIQRERNPARVRRRAVQLVDPVDAGKWMWQAARRELAPIRRYFVGRGVPAAVLTDERLISFRYLAECPCGLWQEGADPQKGLVAPAVIALVVRPFVSPCGREPSGSLASSAQALRARGRACGACGSGDCEGGLLKWRASAVHVTYLNPEGTGTMVRRNPWAESDDPDPMLPKRKMFGPVGKGAVVLGRYDPGAELFVGEGNETVLSGIALALESGAITSSSKAVGVATLSLDNLQGGMRMWKNRTWPLFDVRPDPARPCFTIPGHRGPVTGLVDSDMSPLRGRRNSTTGPAGAARPTGRPERLREGKPSDADASRPAFEGEKIVERRGGPIVRRPITGAERARICGELFVKGWRAATPAQRVDAVRAPLGMDFNDVVRASLATPQAPASASADLASAPVGATAGRPLAAATKRNGELYG